MSLKTVEQLHRDLVKLLESGEKALPQGVVDVFNANLAEAKKALPNDPIVSAISPASAPVSIAPLLIQVGQLETCLEEAKPPRVPATARMA